MIRLIAFAALAIAVTTSVQAMPVAPVHEPEGVITQAAVGCGAGGTGLMVSAWPEPQNVRLAGVHDEMEALACDVLRRD